MKNVLLVVALATSVSAFASKDTPPTSPQKLAGASKTPSPMRAKQKRAEQRRLNLATKRNLNAVFGASAKLANERAKNEETR